MFAAVRWQTPAEDKPWFTAQAVIYGAGHNRRTYASFTKPRDAPEHFLKGLVVISKTNAGVVGTVISASLLLSACSSSPAQGTEASSDPVKGGELVVASLPTVIDPHLTSSRSNWMVAASVCEGLFANAANTSIGNGLADNYEYDPNSGTYTIHLRKGVKLHSGAELTATDVVESLQRYRNGDAGKTFKNLVKDISEADPATVVITTKTPTGALPALLATADTGAYIMSAASLRKAGDKDLTTLDCTGPYKLDSFAVDQQAVVSRFDGYVSRDEKADGATGAKTAYADSIKFIPYSASNSLNQLRTSEVHVVPQWLTMDQLSVYESDPTLKPVVSEGSEFSLVQFNRKAGLMNDLKLRQAVLNAVDPEALATQNLGSTEYFQNISSLFPKSSPWYSEAGKEIYENRSPEKAKQLLKEAGYNGAPVRILYRQETGAFGPLLKQELESVGFTVDLQLMDAATFGSTRTDASKWDLFLASGTAYSDPMTVVFLSDDFPGWWVTEEKTELMSKVAAGKDQAERKPAWEKVQQLIWEDLPFVKLGHDPRLTVTAAKVGGFEATQGTVRGFYNVWLNK
jgi:peptide/nickel transport system substrate-binding protein